MRGMSPSERIRLHLDLDLASEPIEGEVHADGRPALPFVGWIGLTSALEHAVADGEHSINPQEDPHVP